MNILGLDCKVPGEGIQMCNHEVFTSHAAELNQEKFEQLTALSEPEDKDVSGACCGEASGDQQCSKERLADGV
jgi:hypothetical protein